ncbi:MAG: hypothetical protein HON94_15375 [Methylococcales bacterium]|jgi:hypothetical protein|nr:hypothetical protein [Methylococcales bacterium]MBT7408902.1 hypothetical protein [Methylococcales bacterium]
MRIKNERVLWLFRAYLNTIGPLIARGSEQLMVTDERLLKIIRDAYLESIEGYALRNHLAIVKEKVFSVIRLWKRGVSEEELAEEVRQVNIYIYGHVHKNHRGVIRFFKSAVEESFNNDFFLNAVSDEEAEQQLKKIVNTVETFIEEKPEDKDEHFFYQSIPGQLKKNSD